MNILILNWRDTKNPKSGGAEIVTFEHAKGWVKAGHTVTWFTSNFTNSKQEEIIEGIKIIRKGNFISVYLVAPLFYLFSGNKFDIVIDQIHGIPFFTPLYVRKPKIVLIHEVAEEIWDYMYPFPINYIGKLIEPYYFKLYKNVRFWTDAQSTIEDLTRFGIRRSKCVAIDCGISNKILVKLPIKQANPTLIFVSRLVKMKGVEDVMLAFKLLSEKIKGSSLWIVGSGSKDYQDYLQKKAKELDIIDNVKFYGYVSNEKKLELMSKANILLHASIKEGWGIVVIEAASQGTPSVVYDVGGLRESVVDGKTGKVLSANSPAAMAEEVIKLLDDKRRYNQYQKNGIIRARELTWQKAINQSLKLLLSSTT